MCKVTASSGEKPGNFRLPTTVIPSHYELLLFPNPNGEDGRYQGFETITINVLEPTQTIKLNVCKIELGDFVALGEGDDQLLGQVTVDEELEIATLSFLKLITPGEYKLHLNFWGTHKHQLRGFYISTWTDEQGEKHNIATTQHEATEARKTFPCFDEPALKATFKVRMFVEKELTALSNARMIGETPVSETHKCVEFDVTPKMSTYLTCFIVGEFESSEPAFANGKEIRIWCVKGKKHLTSFALKSSVHALTFFEDYFGIPYFGGDKIDHVAIPDFEAGAMENPGCVTYRETALLCDEATAPQSQLFSIAVTNQHETAHFWFGDLVTMFWWNGLWLNEAFATFMESICLAAWKPEWNIWEDFGYTRSGAMAIDGLKSTHPIEMPVNHPDDADELFDAISYNKGGSVLDMIHQFIGYEVFRDGIRIYLNKHAYGNTETHDLWDALELSCAKHGLDLPVREIMDAWVFNAGHPVVSVERGSTPSTIRLSQSQFRFIDPDPTALLPIPLIIKAKSKDGSVRKLKVNLKDREQTVDLGNEFVWVNINGGGSGVYRCRYSPELSQPLLENLSELSVIERFGIVNDTYACVRAGLTTSVEYLQIVSNFVGEEDPNVFGSIIGGLGAMNRLLPKSKRGPIKRIMRKLVTPLFAKLGWTPSPGESIQTTQLRTTCFSVLGGVCESKPVLRRAEEMFQSWLKDRKSVDPNIIGTVVSMLAARGDAARYQEFKKLWKEAKTPFEQRLFLFNLRSFRKPALLRQTLEMCFTGEVSIQESPSLFAGLLGNKNSQKFAWDYLRTNWEQVKTVFPTNMVPNVARACSSLDTPKRAAEVRQFFGANEVKAGKMAVAQMLEQLEIAVRARQTETPRLLAHVATLSK